MQSTTVAAIGIIGDIHCQDDYLLRSIEHLHGRGIEKIYCTGDVVDGKGDVHKCIDYLRNAKVEVVLGNHDDWLLRDYARDLQDATQRSELSADEIKYLATLPNTIDIITPLGNSLLCHGVGNNNMCKINPDDYGYAIDANYDLQALIQMRKYRFVFNGHSHRKMMRDFQGLLVINAGSLLEDSSPGFVTLDFESRNLSFWLIESNSRVVVEKDERL
jgi:predicted phosphodiesterase